MDAVAVVGSVVVMGVVVGSAAVVFATYQGIYIYIYRLEIYLIDFTKRSSAKQLLQNWKCGQRHLNQFWKLWRDEYLLSLQERQMGLKSPRSTATTI